MEEKRDDIKDELWDADTPAWLRSIQLNSWEAELLISALFLYILFQVPDFLQTFRKENFDSSEIPYRLIGIFVDAVRILAIGYVIHIITRGIWVANVGLSYVFPKGIDLNRIKLRGRFKEEMEKDRTLDHSVLRLERLASITYAVSFMLSGLMLSVGVIILTLIAFIEWVFVPAITSGTGWLYGPALFILFVYLLLILIVFIDFLTNGYFRRDEWASGPYYYIAIVFRYLTLSFIYNRALLTILSSMPRWKARLIPFLIVGFLAGYDWVKDVLQDRKESDYYGDSFQSMRFENYESLRKNEDELFVTIQSDVIDEGVIKLFVNPLDEFKELYRRDSTSVRRWRELGVDEKRTAAGKYLTVKIDSTRITLLDWQRYKHPVAYRYGYLAFIDVSNIPRGNHKLTVYFDTLALQKKQVEFLRKQNPSMVVQAKIPFYLTR